MNRITKLISMHKPIPEYIEITDEMRSSLNSEGYTLAQWWIINMMSDPPKYLHHKSSIQGKRGNTAFMIWLQVLHSEPPEWMRHDKYIKNFYGDTAELVWYKFVPSLPPKYLKCVYENPYKDVNDLDLAVESYSSGCNLSEKYQANVLLLNEREIIAKNAYPQYLRFCKKYNIPRPMIEIKLHKWLSFLGTRELNEDNELIYSRF